jgi:hypothetical protein
VDKTQVATINSFCLRFISGKYEKGEFPLHPHSEIVIGRADNLDLILDEDLVSRRHATISTTSNQIIIRDHDSTNGTFVNGMLIKEKELFLGDRILIGSSIMKLIPAHEQTIRRDIEPGQISKIMRKAAEKFQAPSVFEGNIEDVPLPDLIQMLCSNQKNGLLHIDSPQKKGIIRLNEGEIWDARLDNDDVSPYKAWCRLISLESGRFSFETDSEDSERRLKGSTQGLILEAMHQADEVKELIDKLPDPMQPQKISHPLNAPLKDLEPFELEILQALHNHATIDTVLNAITAPDKKICESLVMLRESKYFEEKE